MRLRTAKESVGTLGTDGPLDESPRFDRAAVCACGGVMYVGQAHAADCPSFDGVHERPWCDLCGACGMYRAGKCPACKGTGLRASRKGTNADQA